MYENEIRVRNTSKILLKVGNKSLYKDDLRRSDKKKKKDQTPLKVKKIALLIEQYKTNRRFPGEVSFFKPATKNQ